MSHSYSGPLWTTVDEINFIRGLKAYGKTRALLNYYENLHMRSFDGRGMSVEPHRVRAEAERLLDGLQEWGKRDEEVGRVLEGMENERVGGGSMRAFSQSGVAYQQQVHMRRMPA